MDGDVFNGCINLTSVTINDGCAVIGGSAFSGCTKLRSISIPNSVTTLGSYAFNGCKALEIATIGNGVRIIGSYAFLNCTALESVTMGNKLTDVSYRAFYGCNSLRTITVPCLSVPDADNSAFNYFDATLYVPEASINDYKAHPVWGKFAKIQSIVEDIYLTIIQSEGGRVKMPITKGIKYAIAIEAEEGWAINTVTFNDEDVTSQLAQNIYNTPIITSNSTLRVAYWTTSGVQALNFNDVKVDASGDDIIVKGTEVGELVSVYNIDGKLLNSSVSCGDNMRIHAQSGNTYIIKTGNKTLKIAL